MRQLRAIIHLRSELFRWWFNFILRNRWHLTLVSKVQRTVGLMTEWVINIHYLGLVSTFLNNVEKWVRALTSLVQWQSRARLLMRSCNFENRLWEPLGAGGHIGLNFCLIINFEERVEKEVKNRQTRLARTSSRKLNEYFRKSVIGTILCSFWFTKVFHFQVNLMYNVKLSIKRQKRCYTKRLKLTSGMTN